MRKSHDMKIPKEDMIVRIEDCYFLMEFLVVDMKIEKDLSQALII